MLILLVSLTELDATSRCRRYAALCILRLLCLYVAQNHTLRPKDIDIASLILFIELSSIVPIFSLSRFLSIVLTCSRSTTLSFASPDASALSGMCVGRFAFDCWLVIAAAITVGLKRLPTLFCTIKTGLTPPCSEPTTGLRSA